MSVPVFCIRWKTMNGLRWCLDVLPTNSFDGQVLGEGSKQHYNNCRFGCVEARVPQGHTYRTLF